MNIFKKPYVLRIFGETEIEKGYVRSRYKDRIVKLNVQALSANELLALPEGQRKIKCIKAIGKVEIKTVDEMKGILADRLYYRGNWFECIGADIRDNTPIGQTSAVFSIVTNAEDEALLMPPDMEAIRKGEAAANDNI